ncbi:MAG: methionine--tRNA ligase [Thermoplasmata archaeon]|nr:methionine--tRNA ligase [Thermoplasmata archaeon]
MAKILVAVAWPYTNAPVHFGTVAGACLPADIFARFMRLTGNEVLMVSGSDQHGTPIIFTALEQKTTPEQIAKKYHEINSKALAGIGISYDIFFETSHPNHKKVVQEIFLKLLEKGYIYPKKMPMLYCENCKRFLPDRYVVGICPHCRAEDAKGDQCSNCGKTYEATELVEPECRICGGKPVIRETDHFFLKLSALEEKLKEFINSKTYWRENVYLFTKNLLEAGLKDRPVTRDLEWGIDVPLPNMENKKIYVWFEAVIGYLSSSIEWAARQGVPERWKEFWYSGEARHYYFIGKDNVPFHTIIWPAILIAYDEKLNLPHDIPANEWLQFGGEKISKSKTKESSIFLTDYLAKYPPDALRFYLAMHLPEKHDTSFDWEEFESHANKLLLAAYGNLANRVLVTVLKMDGKIPPLNPEVLGKDEKELLALIENTRRAVEAHISKCEFKAGIEKIMALVHAANACFQNVKVWELLKTDKSRAEAVLHVFLRLLRDLAIMFYPYLPHSSEKLWKMLGYKTEICSWNELDAPLPAGQELTGIKPLFPKIEILRQETALGAKLPHLVVAEVVGVKEVPNAEKLYEIEIDLGAERRKIVSGIRQYYGASELVGKKIVLVANLKKAKIRGIESHGMLLAAEKSNKLSLVVAPALQKGTVLLEGGNGEVSIDEFKQTKLWVKKEGSILCLNAKLPDGREMKFEKAIADREIEDGTEVR